MELTAALEALKTREAGEFVELHTDSEYLRRGITQWMDAWLRNGWMRRQGQPVLNKDLWLALHSQNSRLRVEWRWVKAHAGHTFNELVDEAAREAAIAAANLDESVSQVGGETDSTATEVNKGTKYSIAAVNTASAHSAWAVIRELPDAETFLTSVEEGTSLNRALLSGVVELLRSLPQDEHVCVATDSEYLFKGTTQWLESWRRRSWRKSDGKPVANKDLWIEIDTLLGHIDVTWQYERHSKNQSTGSLVRLAAQRARETLELA